MTETIDIQTLVQDDHNFNKGTDAGRQLMEKSFKELGAGRSILVDRDGRIIAGNKSQQAAIAAGIKKVRIIETTGDELVAVKRTDLSLDSKEGRELALADNLTTQVNLEWDKVELAEVAAQQGIDLPDWGLDPKDFAPDPTEPQEAQEDEFDEEKDAVAPVCQKGDIWLLGQHRLMCGDSTDADAVGLLMGGEKASLVITDPPYNVAVGSKNKVLNDFQPSNRIQEDIENDKGMTDEEIGEKIWKPAFVNLRAFAEDDAAIYVSMPQGGTHMMMMMMMMAAGWQVKHELIWLKNAPTFSLGRLNYDYKHEPIAYGWNKKHNWYSKEPKQSVLCFDKPKKCDLHPTMKPVALWAELIGNSSKAGMIVLDTFGGSGTTIVACEQLHRKARIMELDPHYCDVIIARWEKLTGNKATLLTT